MSERPRPLVRALIVDDERLARATLRLLLEADPEVAVVGECTSAEEALGALAEHEPNLVFLDVHMAEMDGFQLLEAVGPERAFAVIFVTANDTHALRAFEVAAIDYLLKPFDDERFAAALGRAKAHLGRGRVEELAQKLSAALAALGEAGVPGGGAGVAAPRPSPGVPERIAVRDGGKIAFVAVDEIDWIEAEDYYAQLHVGGKTHLLRESLRRLEARLDPRRFVRIHRSTLVNVARIKELEPAAHGESMVVLTDGTELRLSRRYREQLHALLGLE